MRDVTSGLLLAILQAICRSRVAPIHLAAFDMPRTRRPAIPNQRKRRHRRDPR